MARWKREEVEDVVLWGLRRRREDQEWWITGRCVYVGCFEGGEDKCLAAMEREDEARVGDGDAEMQRFDLGGGN